jgi:hypothetical protein
MNTKEYYVSKLAINYQMLIPLNPVNFKDKSKTIYFHQHIMHTIEEDDYDDDMYNLYKVLTLIYRY